MKRKISSHIMENDISFRARKRNIPHFFKVLKKKKRSTPKQQNIQNPLGQALKPNFISKHKVILHCSEICYLRYATLITGLKKFVNSN